MTRPPVAASRRRRLNCALLAAAVAFCLPPSAHLQSPGSLPASQTAGDFRDATPVTDTEWTILGGGATAFELGNSTADRTFAMGAVNWTGTVTGRRGSGPLAGSLAVGIEAMPAFLMFQTDRAFGVGASPLFLRWNFAGRPTLRPFFELAGGLMRTNRPVPEATTRVNFTAQLGAGVRLPLDRTRALVLGYRLHHLSNGGRLRMNPGVNSMFFYSGISFAR